MKAGQEAPTRKRIGRTLVTLPPQVRHAVWREMGGVTGNLLRALVLEALEKRGWDAERRQREYVRYAARCATNGEKNLFPGGRV
jgi:hypothetical protein